MNPFDKITSAATSGMRAQAQRLQVVSENIANADTHGYQRKLVSFENVYDRNLDVNKVEVGRTFLDQTPREEIYDPSHPFANENGYVVMTNVNMMTEFADAREATRSYDAGLEVFRQARDMYSSLLDILKS
ncbi:flagellar basal body rod protein FlgC [Hyphococcus sp.]|uniref:flagellar basal body rod protein FlgC n=1 Tax=Hyphococcus sp. TaxID=2038636 RepID=UPI00208A826A|nr:MAG: flagellar basal body rod protein FlgC [Marinicaulis sp.]